MSKRTAIGKSVEVSLKGGQKIEAVKIFDGWAAKNTGRGYDSMENLILHESKEINKSGSFDIYDNDGILSIPTKITFRDHTKD